jgi:hypothetical protein
VTTRCVLVVGGSWRNIPSWARDAFDIEHIDQEHGDGPFRVKQKADCIVVQVNWTSHAMSGQAHDLGRDWDVPVLKARDGWSSAVAHAARNKVDWFVDAVQLAGRRRKKTEPEKAAEIEEVVDNAWKEHALNEREKAEAAERRLQKIQTKLDKVTAAYERLRSGAEQRVLQAINQRARELRENMAVERGELQTHLDEMATDAAAFIDRLRSLERVLRLGVESDDS